MQLLIGDGGYWLDLLDALGDQAILGDSRVETAKLALWNEQSKAVILEYR